MTRYVMSMVKIITVLFDIYMHIKLYLYGIATQLTGYIATILIHKVKHIHYFIGINTGNLPF